MTEPAEESAISLPGLSLSDTLLQYITSAEDRGLFMRLEFIFPNGYGASIVRGVVTFGGSAGLFEIGILKDGNVLHDHVYGRLSPEAVVEVLQGILELEPQELEPEDED